MKDFATLFARIDESTKTNAKVAALTTYFETAGDDDKLWTIALFSGRRPKRTITATKLRTWAAEVAGLPDWLFEESYSIVGDLAETISLVLPAVQDGDDKSLTYWIEKIKHLSTLDDEARKAGILSAWAILPDVERFLFTKLLTGGFRVGVSTKLMTRALAKATAQDEATLTHKLMGNWTPDTTTFHDLILTDDPAADLSRPYPFYLAYGLDDIAALGDPTHWHAERKWDGIRGQFILRSGEHHVWSRGEELIGARFPEITQAAENLPDGTVLDGEILPWNHEGVMPFAQLQRRIGRKTVGKKLLNDVPCLFLGYDIMEASGMDIRAQSFAARRSQLQGVVEALDHPSLRLSTLLIADSWKTLAEQRDQSRDKGVEGLMLKHTDSPYETGRKRGMWWKWKVAPYTVDAVMLYAQAGHGKRANLYTDYTFGVWHEDTLVPIAKAYSGLDNQEINTLDKWIRKHTLERFGPVRSVEAVQVFELAFEGINLSTRHKSGIAVRFPRIVRWRHDLAPKDADTLEQVKALIQQATDNPASESVPA